MHERDSLQRFLFEHFPIRGHIVRLDSAWRALLEHRDYPPEIRDTLGEAVAASVLLAASLKFDGILSLQLRGEGPMHLMLAQCSSDLGVRAVARYREDSDRRGAEGTGLVGLSGPGHLTVTLGERRFVAALSRDRALGERRVGRVSGEIFRQLRAAADTFVAARAA